MNGCPYLEYTNTTNGADYDCALGKAISCEKCVHGKPVKRKKNAKAIEINIENLFKQYE